jgi:hypothetical protein
MKTQGVQGRERQKDKLHVSPGTRTYRTGSGRGNDDNVKGSSVFNLASTRPRVRHVLSSSS